MDFLMVKIGYNIFELVYLVLFERGRFDFSSMFLHHVCNLMLVYSAYSMNMFKLGGPIMAVHDLTDIFVSFMKIVYEFFSFYWLLLSYLTMLISFIYCRLIVLPFFILKPLYDRYEESSSVQLK